VTNVLGRILAICLGLTSACYSPPQPDCGFVCKRGGECPSDYFCAPDGICHRNGTSPTAPCAIDARVDSPRPIDAPPPDADFTPPGIYMTHPLPGETSVATSTFVRVQFDEPVGGVDAGSFQLLAGPMSINGAISGDPLTWTFTPSAPLATNTTYTVALTTSITDYSGNAFPGYMYQFVTGNF
jgi:hypothetical protein